MHHRIRFCRNSKTLPILSLPHLSHSKWDDELLNFLAIHFRHHHSICRCFWNRSMIAGFFKVLFHVFLKGLDIFVEKHYIFLIFLKKESWVHILILTGYLLYFCWPHSTCAVGISSSKFCCYSQCLILSNFALIL